MEALKVVVKGKPWPASQTRKQCWRFGRRSTFRAPRLPACRAFLAACCITTRSRTTRMRCSRRVW
ncbi:hypothetical protein DM47_4571 [Burkholderia mallei]|nr:hypothetical protein DM47_4571 [Burkholderia mallei]